MDEPMHFDRDAAIASYRTVIVHRSAATGIDVANFDEIARVLREWWRLRQPEGTQSLHDAAFGDGT